MKHLLDVWADRLGVAVVLGIVLVVVFAGGVGAAQAGMDAVGLHMTKGPHAAAAITGATRASALRPAGPAHGSPAHGSRVATAAAHAVTSRATVHVPTAYERVAMERVALARGVPVSATRASSEVVTVRPSTFKSAGRSGLPVPRANVQIATVTVFVAGQQPARATVLLSGNYAPLHVNALWNLGATDRLAPLVPTVLRIGFGKGPSLGSLVLAPRAAAVEIGTNHAGTNHADTDHADTRAGAIVIPDHRLGWQDSIRLRAYDARGRRLVEATATRLAGNVR